MSQQPSSKRAIASRANGSLSRGPKTEAGKRRSSRNAIRHGLLSKNVVLHGESEEAFKMILDCHLARFDPADGVERDAVEEMAVSAWRMRRAWAIETALFDNAVAESAETGGETGRIADAFKKLAQGNDLQLLDRYESRIHRMYQRSLNNFLLLRQFEEALQEDQPLPNEPDSALPNEPNSALPDEPNSALPNEPDSVLPNEPDSGQFPESEDPGDAPTHGPKVVILEMLPYTFTRNRPAARHGPR
jgi:hypothetical protein